MDAGTDTAPPVDAGTDAAPPTDAGPPPIDASPVCRYLDLSIWITDCGGEPRYLRHWTDADGRCPDYYTIGTTRYANRRVALATEGCDPSCLRGTATSVTLLRCGRRTGYISYEDPEMDCPNLLETPDGLFESVADWNAAHPCP